MNRIAFFILALCTPLAAIGCRESDSNPAQISSDIAVDDDGQFKLMLDEVDGAIGKRLQYLEMEGIAMASYQFDGSMEKVVEIMDPLAKNAGYSTVSDATVSDATVTANKTYKHKNGNEITISKMSIPVNDIDMQMLTVRLTHSNMESGKGSQAESLPPQTERFYELSELTKAAFKNGKTDEAREFAEELLQLAPRYKADWNYGNAIHHGNLILGRIAVLEGRVEDAKKLLLEAGKSPGSPQMDSFGPNMSLAKDLLDIGEQEVVLEYFELCRKFWDMGHSKLDTWSNAVKSGNTPSFGANLVY